MMHQWPDPSTVWRAIEIYLAHAYPAQPPASVRARLETLRSQPVETFFDNVVFDKRRDGQTQRLMVRLGNRQYPHMKLSIESRPDGQGWLFRTDTHDAHCCPPEGSGEHVAFRQLMEVNRQIAQAIESDWEQNQIATFKTYLKEDLARRSDKG